MRMHLNASLTFEIGRLTYVFKVGQRASDLCVRPRQRSGPDQLRTVHRTAGCCRVQAARSARTSTHAHWTPAKPSTNSQTRHCGVCAGWSIMYVRVKH